METAQPRVLATAVLPARTATIVGGVVGFALLTALAAQVRIPLPFTPVPITGQTLAVLLAGAVLGGWAGAASQGLYLLLGLVGLPVFAGGNGGVAYATGPTLGYLVGFVVAAYVVGRLAERGQDRSPWTALPAFLAGNAVIYVLGVAWLWWSVPQIATIEDALVKGLVPFIVGDSVKIALAGFALPTAWRLVD